jgi:TRAP-type C4-dicarboxylate transport system permease small subunit
MRGEPLVRLITSGLAITGLVAMLLLACATLIDGFLRWAINQPIDAVRDLGSVVAAAAMSSCIPYVIANRANITIRFVSNFIGGWSSRIADIVAACLIVVVLVGMAYEFYLFASQALRVGEMTPLLGIPVAPFWYWVDAMLALASVVQAKIVVDDITGISDSHSAGQKQGSGRNVSD